MKKLAVFTGSDATRVPRPDSKATIGPGKSSGSEKLPSRSALNSLTRGDPAQRSMGQYSKKTPTGAGGISLPGAPIVRAIR